MESALSERARDPGLRLIETLLWDGATYPRWALHEARLTASAAAFGWATPRVALPRPDGPARVRLLAEASGAVGAEVFALPPAKPLWRVGIAAEPLAPSPLRPYKTNQRADYEAARAAMGDLDEVLLLNGRGEVCEGTITSVFFDRGQGMRTPPLASGLLAGVLRAELALPEEVLRVEDLPKVRLWVGNALRGLIPAELV